jgi:hypothetical protein
MLKTCKFVFSCVANSGAGGNRATREALFRFNFAVWFLSSLEGQPREGCASPAARRMALTSRRFELRARVNGSSALDPSPFGELGVVEAHRPNRIDRAGARVDLLERYFVALVGVAVHEGKAV